MRLAFITFSLLILLSVKGFANDKVIFHFEGKEYKTIVMTLATFDGSSSIKTMAITGKSDDGKTWVFEYDDSSFENMCSATFKCIDETANISHIFFFDKVINKDTLSSGTITFSERQSEVNLRYYKTQIVIGGGTYNQSEKRYTDRRVVQDHFLVEGSNDSGILSAIECSNYIYCGFIPYPGQSYEGQLNKYITITKKYPDSKLLAWIFVNQRNLFHSKQDIKTVYQCFSEKIHQSVYGKYIEDFLDSTITRFEFHTFINSYLPSSSTDSLEPIIRDSHKYNLIIFSASTCRPCRAEVPILKKIYNEYSSQLEMTYVTIDPPQYIGSWRSFLKNQQIPWRSLEASNNIAKTKTKYFVDGIPYTLLVAPGGNDLRVKTIDVRRQEDLNYLANVLNTQDLAKDSISATSENGDNGKSMGPKVLTQKSQADSQKQLDGKILYVVDGLKTSLENVRKLDRNSIESIDVLNGKNNVSAYSNGDYNQVVLIKLKKGITKFE